MTGGQEGAGPSGSKYGEWASSSRHGHEIGERRTCTSYQLTAVIFRSLRITASVCRENKYLACSWGLAVSATRDNLMWLDMQLALNFIPLGRKSVTDRKVPTEPHSQRYVGDGRIMDPS